MQRAQPAHPALIGGSQALRQRVFGAPFVRAAARNVQIGIVERRWGARAAAAPPLRPRAFADEAEAFVHVAGDGVARLDLKHSRCQAVRVAPSDHVQAGLHQLPGDAAPAIIRVDGHIGDDPGGQRGQIGRVNRGIADDAAIFDPDEAQADALGQFVHAQQGAQARPQPTERAHFAHGGVSAAVHRIGEGQFDQIGQRCQIGAQIDRAQPGRAGRFGNT